MRNIKFHFLLFLVVEVATAYISDSPSPEHTVNIDDGPENDPIQIDLPVVSSQSTTPTSSRSIAQRNIMALKSQFRPRVQTFQPANISHQIPTVRMGPPYPGIRNQVPFSMPLPAKPPVVPRGPTVFRNRLFSPGKIHGVLSNKDKSSCDGDYLSIVSGFEA